jgi:sortase (surface protein transpeptidase)
MKSLRFVMMCALIIVLTVAVIGGCKNKGAEEALVLLPEEKGEEPYENNANFTGDMVRPVKMTIEKIGVIDVDVVGVHPENEGDHMPVPAGAIGVTWLDTYASPGWECNAILTGHNYVNNEPGTFARLHELGLEDIVKFTYEDESVGTFRVFHLERYPENEVPEWIMLNEGATRTTLITCDGERKLLGGGYPYRIIYHLGVMEHVDKDGNPLQIEVPEETDTDEEAPNPEDEQNPEGEQNPAEGSPAQ